MFSSASAGDVDSEQWQTSAEAHYDDEVLERVRRDRVRLCMREPLHRWSERQSDQPATWARELRAAAG
jgi:hypothetical protein